MPPFEQIRTLLTAAAQAGPWTRAFVLLAAQVLGAVGLALALGISDVWLPIAVLGLGCLASLLLRRCDDRRWFWIPPAVYALFIFLLSNRSFSDTTLPVPADLFHPVEYLTLAVLLSPVWENLLEEKRTGGFLARVIATGLFFGATDELHQAFIPGRTPSAGDLVLDFTGLALGCWIVVAARMRRSSVSPTPSGPPR
ncbi:MAG: VanZ family protein [Acidobacteriota bacterium]